jgi:hypothetical protein
VALRTRLLPLAAIAAAAIAAQPAAAANSNSLYVNAADARPQAISPERLYELSDASARRWKLSVLGHNTAAPGVKDNTQVIGFSADTNPQALGVTTVWSRNRYRLKTTKRCWRQNGKRRCQTSRRYVKVGVEVMEKDVQLNPFVPWEQGPAYPTPPKYDLESTILHELGHFANPMKDNHVSGCENTPMIESIAPGEYWRDADDWLRYGCSASTGLRPKLAAPAYDELEFQVVEHRLPPVYER